MNNKWQFMKFEFATGVEGFNYESTYSTSMAITMDFFSSTSYLLLSGFVYKTSDYFFIMVTVETTYGTFSGYYKSLNYGSSSDYMYP